MLRSAESEKVRLISGKIIFCRIPNDHDISMLQTDGRTTSLAIPRCTRLRAVITYAYRKRTDGLVCSVCAWPKQHKINKYINASLSGPESGRNSFLVAIGGVRRRPQGWCFCFTARLNLTLHVQQQGDVRRRRYQGGVGEIALTLHARCVICC